MDNALSLTFFCCTQQLQRDISTECILRTDEWIYTRIKRTVAPRYLSLTQKQLQSFLVNHVWPNVEKPADVTKESVTYNFAVIGRQYFRCARRCKFRLTHKVIARFYKGLINKARASCYSAIATVEKAYHIISKLRGNTVRGRDLMIWYSATADIAEKLENIVKGEEEGPEFRVQMLTDYNSKLSQYSSHF